MENQFALWTYLRGKCNLLDMQNYDFLPSLSLKTAEVYNILNGNIVVYKQSKTEKAVSHSW